MRLFFCPKINVNIKTKNPGKGKGEGGGGVKNVNCPPKNSYNKLGKVI